MKKNKENPEQDTAKQSFITKMKSDKKYRAKVELAGYGIIIILIVIYVNLSNLTNNYDYNKPTNKNLDIKTDTEEKQTNLLEKLNNNYNYTIEVSVKKAIENADNEETKETETKYNYNGKSYKNNLIINKKINDVETTYYKVQNEYYQKEQDNYNKIEESTIYDLIESKYIELENIKKYIETSNLDHFTNYSSGKKEYVYNLSLSDIVPNYKENDIVPINITTENEVVTINIDYTKLLKISDKTINECIINYTYSDIDKVEEFSIIEESKDEANSETSPKEPNSNNDSKQN